MKARILVGAVAALLYGGVAMAGGDKDCPAGYDKKDTQARLGAQEVQEEDVEVIETTPVEDYEGFGGSGLQEEPMREPEVSPPSGAFAPVVIEDEDEEDTRSDMRGLTVTLGGGVEGYTGDLAPEINPGPAYGVTAAIKPSRVLGIELGYSGAVNNLDNGVLGADSGPDLVRNGGHAAVTLGLSATPVQPYLLGGIGFSDINFRGNAAAGFEDDMVGSVPVGAGLRTYVGDFSLDLRGNYNFLFDQEFADVDTGFSETGRYSGTLNIGGTF